jgi:hypothetical protein
MNCGQDYPRRSPHGAEEGSDRRFFFKQTGDSQMTTFDPTRDLFFVLFGLLNGIAINGRHMMNNLIVALALVAFAPIAVHADGFDGHTLYRDCADKSPGRHDCTVYLRGAVDVLLMLQAQDKDHREICTPESVTGEQLADAVMKWFHENPEDRQHGFGQVIAFLAVTWPCPR